MNEHAIFYYPCGSFDDEQVPLLKVVALYFDKLYILDLRDSSVVSPYLRRVRPTASGLQGIEYLEGTELLEARYGDYSLPVGESIMINHTLFASLLHTGAVPLTDDPFHDQVLRLKLKRAREIPEVRGILDDLAKRLQVKESFLAADTIRDTQLNLPALTPDVPLEEVINFRKRHEDELLDSSHVGTEVESLGPSTTRRP